MTKISKGAFNNYVDRILPVFDPSTAWTVFTPWVWTKTDIFWPLPRVLPSPTHLVHLVIEWACEFMKKIVNKVGSIYIFYEIGISSYYSTWKMALTTTFFRPYYVQAKFSSIHDLLFIPAHIVYKNCSYGLNVKKKSKQKWPHVFQQGQVSKIFVLFELTFQFFK